LWWVVTRLGVVGPVSAVSRRVGFRVLGSLEVETGGRVLGLGGPRLRALLALMVASAGHAVSVPALVEALWWENTPVDAHRTVRTYVSRLRKAIGPPEPILTRAPGYVLLVDPDAIDAARFERLAVEGRHALDTGQPAAAAGRLRAALGLWRGPAYAEFGDIAELGAEGMRLEQLRRTAVEDRIEADLARFELTLDGF
jgi:DNA-binding SARP family transcriptional activator